MAEFPVLEGVVLSSLGVLGWDFHQGDGGSVGQGDGNLILFTFITAIQPHIRHRPIGNRLHYGMGVELKIIRC